MNLARMLHRDVQVYIFKLGIDPNCMRIPICKCMQFENMSLYQNLLHTHLYNYIYIACFWNIHIFHIPGTSYNPDFAGEGNGTIVWQSAINLLGGQICAHIRRQSEIAAFCWNKRSNLLQHKQNIRAKPQPPGIKHEYIINMAVGHTPHLQMIFPDAPQFSKWKHVNSGLRWRPALGKGRICGSCTGLDSGRAGERGLWWWEKVHKSPRTMGVWWSHGSSWEMWWNMRFLRKIHGILVTGHQTWLGKWQSSGKIIEQHRWFSQL